MSRQYLFDFFLQHTYRTLRGKLSLLAGLAMIPLCVLTWNRVGRMFSVCYIFFAVFFLLLMPENFGSRRIRDSKEHQCIVNHLLTK